MNFRNVYTELAVGFYTSGEFPDNWEHMTHEGRAKWCEDNPWQPFEDYDGEWILLQAETLEEAFISVAKRAISKK